MRLGVRQLPSREELLHLRSIGGERAASIGRHALDHLGQRKIQPRDCAIGEHQRTVVRLDERPAAGCDHHMPKRQQLAKRQPLQLPEIGLALLGKDRRDGPMLSGLDALIDVLDPPACELPDGARDRRFAGSHEADKIQLVGFHARSDSRTEKNSG